MAHNYILQVTAGSEYDITKHQIVPVNTATPITIDSEHISVSLNVRIAEYRGLPRTSPSTSPYFSLPPHNKSKDQYSIAFEFTPKKPINGNDLVFGNDFDHPIRDRLPPGFGTAFKIVKWVVDPGLDGDVYADQPYLYGPAASSVNTLHIGSKGGKSGTSSGTDTPSTSTSTENEDAGLIFTEGGDSEGLEHRKEKGVPETEAARKKFFLNEENRKAWEWEEGRSYGCDFFNPYLDFNDFALRLPGFTLPIMKYWDGQGLRKEPPKRSHTLRYVLKNRATDTVLFVVLFTLYLKEDVDESGIVKDGVEGGKPLALMGEKERRRHERAKNGLDGEEEESGDSGDDEKKGEEKVEEKNGYVGGGDDDVD
ncbi:uncharacterized protein PAC_05926 [Phialocephala subalpina]|uniref:Domain of unknown function at the cortex 1 domain-containing protein n=1 Tax=Phialocephala subalpina TaxID=576137 RepID=A0A1L7WTD0_9HELO|nr:uncharacterized protein PAC_05926 [Phialocephala subalpina]